MKLVGFYIGEVGLAADFAWISEKAPILSEEGFATFETEAEPCLLLFCKTPVDGVLALQTQILPLPINCDVGDLTFLQLMVGHQISITQRLDEGCLFINCENGKYLQFVIDPQFAQPS